MSCPIGEKCNKESNVLTCYPCIIKKCNQLKEAVYHRKLVVDKIKQYTASYNYNYNWGNWTTTYTSTSTNRMSTTAI